MAYAVAGIEFSFECLPVGGAAIIGPERCGVVAVHDRIVRRGLSVRSDEGKRADALAYRGDVHFPVFGGGARAERGGAGADHLRGDHRALDRQRVRG